MMLEIAKSENMVDWLELAQLSDCEINLLFIIETVLQSNKAVICTFTWK